MKTFSDVALDEIEAGTAVVSAAVEIACDPPIRLWGGHGTLPIPNVGADGATAVFEGVGDRGLAQSSAGAVGGAAQAVNLTLSGIEPFVLELLDAAEVQGAPVTVWRLIFKGNGRTLLDAHVFTRGRLDRLLIENVVGGLATIKAMVESSARGLGRRGGRMRTDADQRLINPTDGFFKNIAFAAVKTLHWGGPKPETAGSVLRTGGGSGGYADGGGDGRLQMRHL
jgi:hypothetical protein